MELDVRNLLDELACALRTVCSDPDLSLLLYRPPVAMHDVLLAASGAGRIPEFDGAEAARRFVLDRLEGQRGPLEIRQLQSEDGQSILLDVPFSLLMRASGTANADRQVTERRQHAPPMTASLLEGGLCIASATISPVQALMGVLNLDGDSPSNRDVLSGVVLLASRLLCAVFDLTCSIKDPVSLLPGRAECEAALARNVAQLVRNDHPLGVLLISPDDFVMVNHRFGRENGDRALREIADRLRASVREADRLFRYGGAALSVILPGTAPANVELAARKFQRTLSDGVYLDGQLELTFTVGGAYLDADDIDDEPRPPIDVLRRAEYALHAARIASDGGIQLLSMSQRPEEGAFNPDSGIFTADSEKDYRNMLLLWDSVALISSNADPVALAATFIERLMARFWADRIRLLRSGDAGQFEQLACRIRQDGGTGGEDAASPREEELALVRQALAGRQLEQRAEPRPGRSLAVLFALPLLVADKSVGCLLIEGSDEHLNLAATDLIFLNALANQLAIALDRIALTQHALERNQQENLALRSEVRELRHVFDHTRMVYESVEMETLMTTLRRIATTDATTLIVGESGTGKEMLAKAVHDHSDRRAGPFITVDCGAIAHTLLEAELFGRSKGAYTGADAASAGRILQAGGGTLFLDEIGELPMEVQAKLLRFVQELEITPVGSSVSQKVDVRIVAATNRDLVHEVESGRFRQDLYYRLQVVMLDVPPLRRRPQDILPLAHFFVRKAADQHGLDCAGIDPEAERLLVSYAWPGNVRELQHCMLRSALMCDGDSLGPEDVMLAPQTAGPAVDRPQLPPQPVTRPSTKTALDDDSDDEALARCLEEQVLLALQNNPDHPVPLGRWLQEDLVLAVSAVNNDIGRRAARFIGIPESTFRRQIDKIRPDRGGAIALRNEDWVVAQNVVQRFVEQLSEADAQGLLDRLRLMLLQIVKTRTVGKDATGAALMGVTPPTYRRWLTQGDRAA